MVSLSKFIDPDLSAEGVQHSSGYVSPNGQGGGGGGLSMEKRRQLLHQPRIVGAYNRSHLGRRYSAIKARTADHAQGRAYDANTDTFSDKAKFSYRRPGGSVGSKSASPSGDIQRRQHFVEPPARKYNPYG